MDMSLTYSAGSYLPLVYVADEGYIPLDPSLDVYEIEVKLFACLPATGSKAGGQEITITGEHIGNELYLDEETTSLTMGGKLIEVVY